uniref:Uncharacterized protein n=1 Tax=Romanomermis culicivorax TaxID=13658 RepID=A0A915IZU0_ROMCU
MTNTPIDQTTSKPVLPTALFEPPLVEAIAIAMQEEIQTTQATNPAISKIVKALQATNAAIQPSVFFVEDGILYPQA